MQSNFMLSEKLDGIKDWFIKLKNWIQKNIFETHWKWVAIFLPILMYVVILSVVSISKYNLFRNAAHCTGIFTQAVWKFANFDGLFNTVRGLNIWGDHLSFTMILYAPLYKIFPSVYTILIQQSIVLAIGGFGIYLIAKDRLKNKLLAFFFMLIYLINPALQNSNLSEFYPEVIATSFAVFAFYFIIKEKYIGFWVCFILGILTKEDIALTYSFFAIYIFFTRNKKVGLIAFIISIVYFLLAIFLFLKIFNGVGFFRFEIGDSQWFDEFSVNKFNIFFHIDSLFNEKALIYMFKLLFPLCFISLLELPILLIALPALFINLSSRQDIIISVVRHYNVSIIPFVYISAIYGFGKLLEIENDYKNNRSILNKRSPIKSSYALIMIFCCSLISFYSFSTMVWGVKDYFKIYVNKNSSNIKPVENSNITAKSPIKSKEDIKIALEAIKLIPKNSSVSASSYILPHVEPRRKLYYFPNPFISFLYGLDFGGKNRNSSINYNEEIDYIIFNKNEYYMWTSVKWVNEIFENIIDSGKYEIIFNKGDTYLLKLRNSNYY